MNVSTNAVSRCHRWRLIIAISAGNAFEWFDFIIFGYFAVAIAKQFFPADDRAASLLLSLAVFGAAFIMRPLGAVALGFYADRYGRKPALTLTISLMMLGTALIGLAPSYETIGIFAPCIVLVGRLIQGLSAGGEFGSATALLAEQDPRSRGFYASWQFASQAAALVIATSLGTALSLALDARQLDGWGWRIPFLLGVLIGPIGIYIRSRIPESMEFRSVEISRSPARELAASFGLSVLISLGLVVAATVTVYTLVFMPSFAVQYLGLSMTDGFLASLCTGLVQMVMIPAAGALSDRYGRLPLAGAASTAILIIVHPLLSQLTLAPSFTNLLIFQIVIGSLLAVYLGTLPAMMSELFVTRVRTTGLSVSYSVAVAVFGGFAPLVNTFLIELLENNNAPAYYVLGAATISMAAIIAIKILGIRSN